MNGTSQPVFVIEVFDGEPMRVKDPEGNLLQTCPAIDAAESLTVQSATVLTAIDSRGARVRCVITSDGRIICR